MFQLFPSTMLHPSSWNKVVFSEQALKQNDRSLLQPKHLGLFPVPHFPFTSDSAHKPKTHLNVIEPSCLDLVTEK